MDRVSYLKRAKKLVKYHGRKGYPVIYTAKSGRRFIRVRAKGGGTKRLYEGSLYKENKSDKISKILVLGRS